MTSESNIYYRFTRIFKLSFDGHNNVTIYKRPFKNGVLMSEATEVVTTINKYVNIWFGYDPRYMDNYLYFGNTVLVNVKDDIYMYIGDCIYYFRTEEPIIDFVSEVSCGISFPYMIIDKGYLLLSEKVFIPKNIVSYKANFYDFYFKNRKNENIYNFKYVMAYDNYLI